MTTEERRAQLYALLTQAQQPLTGSALARKFGVSRQIIVGDIGILRAEGAAILATPRGYLLPRRERQGVMATAPAYAMWLSRIPSTASCARISC